MIARFVGQADIISGMIIKQGKVYNVEYLYQAQNEWLWFRISEIEQDKRDGDMIGAALFGIAWMFVKKDKKMEIEIPYSSWLMFYANWQPIDGRIEEVHDIKNWRYIPNWPEKHLTCTFCGTDRSVKYSVMVKDVNGKDCHVPCCNRCVLRKIE